MARLIGGRTFWLWWMAATVVWLAFVLVLQGETTFRWLGYHTSNVHSIGDLLERFRDKARQQAVKDACAAAARELCARRPLPQPIKGENEYDVLLRADFECLRSSQFLERLQDEASARSVPGAQAIRSGEACQDFRTLDLPYFHWPTLLLTLAVPLVPILGVMAYRVVRKVTPRLR